MLADIESLERLDKKIKISMKTYKSIYIYEKLNNGKDLSELPSEFEEKIINQTGLLSIKPKIYVCNVDEKSVNNGNNYTDNFIKIWDK